MYSILIGCTALICGYIRTALWNLLAERQIRIIRQTLFRSILRKDIDYFDRHKTGELSTCLTDDINKIHAGIGDKFGTAIEIASTFTSCLIIGKILFVAKILRSKLGMYRFSHRMEINISCFVDVTNHFFGNHDLE
jgi:ABC-type multidrug transport system fused ATPase/permease subunit